MRYHSTYPQFLPFSISYTPLQPFSLLSASRLLRCAPSSPPPGSNHHTHAHTHTLTHSLTFTHTTLSPFSLSINGCGILEIPEHLACRKTLHSLHLNSVHISDKEMRLIFSSLEVLERLSICRASPLSTVRVPSGNALRSLTIKGCLRLTTFAIRGGDHLEHLALSNNPRIDRIKLRGWTPKLRTLSLRALPLVIRFRTEFDMPQLSLFQVRVPRNENLHL